MKQLLFVAPIVCVVALLGGCAVSPSSGGWSEPDVPGSVPKSEANDALPFDSYALGSSDREQLQIKEAALLNDCLSDYGLEATFAGDHIQQVSEDPSAPYWFQWGGRPGFLPLEQAQEYGYAQAPGTPWVNGSGFYMSSPSNIFNVESGEQIQDAKLSGVLFGPENAVVPGPNGPGEKLGEEQIPRDESGKLPPKGGCFNLVEDEIGVPFVDLRPIESEILGLALNDEAVAKVNASWVSCMKSAGYSYPRFDGPMNDVWGTPNQTKIETAVTDVKCTQSSHWPDTLYFVLADYQQQAIEKQPDFFQSALTAERERLEKLNTLVG